MTGAGLGSAADADADAALLRGLFDDAPDGLLVAAADGCVRRANGVAERLVGGRVAGRHLSRVLGVPCWAAVAAARGTGVQRAEWAGDRWRVAWTALPAAGGAAELLLHLREADAQSGSRLREAGAVHDLSNVLAMILGAAAAAGEGDTVALAGLADMARRGQAMVRALLGAHAAAPPAAEIAVDTAVAALQPALGHVCGPALSLHFTGGAPGSRVRLPAHMLERVLLNLVANARDALGGRGTVSVRTRRADDGAKAGGHILIEVCDDGPGMPPQISARAGEPFFTTKAAGQGTGLGLATVRDLLAQAGGWLTIDSTFGHGTRAGVHLPEAPADKEPPSAAARTRQSTRGTVLLVEDEVMLRGLTARALDRAGWDVRQAGSGEAALALLGCGAGLPGLAVLVTDMALPGLSGAGLVRAVRSFPSLERLPAILVSGFAGAAMADLVVDHPPIPVLAKPFAMRELTDAVESLAARAAAAPLADAEVFREK